MNASVFMSCSCYSLVGVSDLAARMTYLYHYYLLASLLQLCNCQISESNCERALPTEADLEADGSAFDEAVASLLGEGSNNVAPQIQTLNYTCLAQGTTEGLYRAVSITVEYYLNIGGSLTSDYRHFQLLCYDDLWQLSDDGFEDQTVFTSDTPTRYDCENCRSGLDANEHHCIRKYDNHYPSVYIHFCTNFSL